MTVDEARRILKGKPGSLDALGPAYVRYATAADTLGAYYRANRHELTPIRFTDAAPRRREETPREVVDRYAREDDAEVMKMWVGDQAEIGAPAGTVSPGGVTIGSKGGGRVGPKLIQRLPHSGFSIMPIDGSDAVGLFEHVDPNTKSAPVQTAVEDRRMRALLEYESVRTKARLQSINRKNSEFWSKNQR